VQRTVISYNIISIAVRCTSQGQTWHGFYKDFAALPLSTKIIIFILVTMKTKQGILKHTETLVILALWLVIMAMPVLLFQRNDTINWSNVFIAWLGVLPFLLLFLVNHFLLIPFLFFKKSKALYLISALSLVLGFTFTTWFMEKGNSDFHPKPLPRMRQLPPPQFENQQPPERPPRQGQQGRNPIPFPPFVNTFIVAILVIGFDAGLRMIFRWSKMEQEKTLLEKENVQNQLAFLRTQVSPHFFMNTLNNIHALIDVDTEEAKDSIIKLSKLMRHLLYESQGEKTSLKKEVEFIKSYVNLMKLRFSDKVKIGVIVPDIIPEKEIPPLLFTSVIENAFKHGISYSNASFINIKISIPENKFQLEVANSKAALNVEKDENGIGLENTKKRLELLYPGKYDFKIIDNIEDFTVIISIPL